MDKALEAAMVKRLREALEKLADAADGVGVQFFDTDTMAPEVEAMQTATLEARALLQSGEGKCLSGNEGASDEHSTWRPMPAEQAGVYPFTGARMIVGWDDTATLPMHVELGRWRSGTGKGSGWCNTYGHSFGSAPTHYWPLPAPPSKAETVSDERDGTNPSSDLHPSLPDAEGRGT